MAITLRTLCKYAGENYDLRLICGEYNLNNIVNWVHMLEDPETAAFLHGQELIFSTGIGHDNTDWYLDFAKQLVAKQVSGLVLNTGPYIDAVPLDLIEYCKEVDFPLFTIPWKTRIVDITNDFCRKIIKFEENEISVVSAFRNAIFFPEKIAEYSSILERKEFNLNAEFCVFALLIHSPLYEDLTDGYKLIKLQLSKILFNYSDRFALFRQDKHLIVILQEFPQNIIENSIDLLNEKYYKNNDNYSFYVGISSSNMGVKSLSRNYKKALSLLQIAKKQDKYKILYKDVGLYQLLIEVEDTKALKRYFEDNLGKLQAYDQKNKTDYLDTLKCYLDNNASVQDVAKKTYVHRNTINYKMKKIKEILDCELNFQDSLRFMLAFQIQELL